MWIFWCKCLISMTEDCLLHFCEDLLFFHSLPLVSAVIFILQYSTEYVTPNCTCWRYIHIFCKWEDNSDNIWVTSARMTFYSWEHHKLHNIYQASVGVMEINISKIALKRFYSTISWLSIALIFFKRVSLANSEKKHFYHMKSIPIKSIYIGWLKKTHRLLKSCYFNIFNFILLKLYNQILEYVFSHWWEN